MVFRPHPSLRQEPVHPKDPVPTLQKGNVVHRILCTSCSSAYVGQTSRTLEAHLKEHKAAVKHARTSLSAVADHVWTEHHQMDFSGTSVLARELHTHQRCMLEAWFIRKHSTLNIGRMGVSHQHMALCCDFSCIYFCVFLVFYLFPCLFHVCVLCVYCLNFLFCPLLLFLLRFSVCFCCVRHPSSCTSFPLVFPCLVRYFPHFSVSIV